MDVWFILLRICRSALYTGKWPDWTWSDWRDRNIYMEEFQIRAMETSPHPLDQWFWYFDDSELKCKNDQSDAILTHLNNIKPDIIKLTKGDQAADVLPMLDLKQKINRKTKQVECMVHYKKTHTNINIREKSNHSPYVKKGVIKGFADRARALCDDDHLEDELKKRGRCFCGEWV